LPPDWARLGGRCGIGVVHRRGLRPGAIDSTAGALTDAMRHDRWDGVPALIADLCHYCADLTEPLHCTENVDGQRSGQGGIHVRYETELLARHTAQLDLAPGRARVPQSVLDTAMAQAASSQREVAGLLEHDREAARLGVGPPAYYERLWALEGAATRQRLARAADLTAGFLCVAWRRAGMPTPPDAKPARAGAD